MRFDFNLPYDKKYLIRCLAGIAAAVVVMKLTRGNGFVAAFALLFTCFSRNNMELLFFTLIMSILILLGNPNLISKGGVFGMAQRLLMLTLSGVMFLRLPGMRKSRLVTSMLWLLPYVFFMLVPSLVGWCPMISYMKLFLFFMVYMAYFSVTNAVLVSPRVNSKKVRSVFLMLAAFVIFGSIALIPLPGYGQMSWEQMEATLAAGGSVTSLFMGMMSHSQMLGPTVSILGVLVYADMIFSVKKVNKLYLALLVCAPIILWKTSSRTAMGSFISGVAFTTFLFMQSRGVKSNWKSKVFSSVLMLITALGLVILVVPSTREKAVQFVMKSHSAEARDVSFDSVVASRRGLWDEGLANFRKSPLMGNGFQVSESMIGFRPSLTTLSAPVEKGVWISAILEEGGAVGFFLFVIFALVAGSSLYKNKCYLGLVSFIMLLMINMGEFTMFSMSGIGGLLWALVFTGIVLDGQRLRDEKRRMIVPYI